jgi:hypothetical protein
MSRTAWAARRYFSVMIPHWIVITPVLLANWLFQYKPVSVGTAIVTFMGGNLFLHDPVYVITWYVTFVLLLYAYLLIDSFFRGWQRLIVSAFGFAFFGWMGTNEYFWPFTVGLYAAAWFPIRLHTARRPMIARLAGVSYQLQELCYPFFLVHGGIQLVFFKLGWTAPVPLFVASLAASCVAAVIVAEIAKPAMKWVGQVATSGRLTA